MSFPNDASSTVGGYGTQPAATGGAIQSPVPPAHIPRQYEVQKERESKPAFLTTEFYAYLATVAAIVIASIYFNGDGNEPDEFTADQALRYITWLTIGYMVARGLAKAGWRDVGEARDR